MKLFIVLGFVAAASCMHLNVLDINANYKEGDRYIYFPDGDGVVHLVDLHEEVPEEVSTYINTDRLHYYLFTRANPTQRQELFLNNPQSLRDSDFDPTKPVKIIVHGWRSTANSGVNPRITAATLAYTDVNVIVLDWSHFAGSLNYIYVTSQVPHVGAAVGEFVDFLSTQGVFFENIQLVGFSLGGHVIGAAARSTRLGRIPWITALDPAGPNFGPGNSERLRASDAVYVEVIHTNAGIMGNADRLGDVDFFPNGGYNQPGCTVLKPSCSHSRAYEFYAETIGNEQFTGQGCDSVSDARKQRCNGSDYLHMGGAWTTVNKNGDGIYHLRTNSRSPFAQQ